MADSGESDDYFINHTDNNNNSNNNNNIDDYTNQNHNISCECEASNQRPVDYLGDSICKISASSVREIVKKYEPDKEISSIGHNPVPYYNTGGFIGINNRSYGSTSSRNDRFSPPLLNNNNNSSSSSGGSGGRIDNASSDIQNKSDSNKSGFILSHGAINKTTTPAVALSSGKKFNVTNHVSNEEQTNTSSQQQTSSLFHHLKDLAEPKDNQNSKMNPIASDFGNNITDSSYKSKTSISKTSQGVRITTDIFFDSNSKIPENWIVKRVETDIPQSKILNEFQKYSSNINSK